MEEQIKKAKEIWAAIRTPMGMGMSPDARLEYFQAEYRAFSQAFPIVMRYMCQFNQFHAGAFEKFLRRMRTNPGKGIEGYLEMQAHWPKLLYMHTTNHYDPKLANAIYKDVYNTLLEENRTFEELHKKFKEEQEQQQAVTDKERKDELIAFLRKLKEDAATRTPLNNN